MTQIDFNNILQKLNTNLNNLREREARYAGNTPLELLNQIEDHRQAIVLTEQAIAGEIDADGWYTALKSLAVDQTIVSVNFSQRSPKISPLVEIKPQQLRNRTIMLQRVYDFWVKGVLERSLGNEALINLEMEERQKAVEQPLEMILKLPDRPDRRLPPGTRIIDVFDGTNGLLILGEPGSGKTTMLLELARQLITRAKGDPLHPIPIILNLSKWGEMRLPFNDWLVKELQTSYQIPEKLAQNWVETEQLLFLLDGLDEVAQPHQDACVKAINLFRGKSLAPLVVCSRVTDYQMLSNKLILEEAIELQPLSPALVKEHLSKFGLQYQTLRIILESNSVWQELAQIPLMLSVMMLAYKDLPSKQLPKSDNLEKVRRYIFDSYIKQMIAHHRTTPEESYSSAQTINWLKWLAQKMQSRFLTDFFIEEIQPDWLEHSMDRRLFALITSLVAGLTGGIFIGLFLETFLGIMGNLFNITTRLSSGLSLAIITGATTTALFGGTSLVLISFGASLAWLLILAFLGIGDHFLITTASSLLTGSIAGLVATVNFKLDFFVPSKITRQEILLRLAIGFISAIFLTFLAVKLTDLGEAVSFNSVALVILVFAAGLLTGSTLANLVENRLIELLRRLGYAKEQGMHHLNAAIEPRDKLSWTWQNSITFAIIVTPITWLLSNYAIGIVFGLCAGLLAGFQGSSSTVEVRAYPNQAIRISALNAVKVGLLGLLIGGVAGFLLNSTLAGLVVALALISAAVLAYGGYSVIQHYLLRLILWWRGDTPWDLSGFLDYAVSKVFLRRVGGHYIFVHRMLKEHFAKLNPDEFVKRLE